MSTRRRKRPTFRPSFICISSGQLGMSTALSSLSVQAPRIPSGLLFVIHSINVCCLWDLLFAVILSFSFCLIRMYSFLVLLMFAFFSSPIHTVTHCWPRTCFAYASKWWWDSLHQNMCRCSSSSTVCVWLFCVFKFAQTLTIVPRVALNWYTVFFCLLILCIFLSQNFLWKTSVVFTYYKR